MNIEQRIMNLRSDISMLDQMNNERPSQKMIKNNNMMATKCNTISEKDQQVALETNKQRLQATSDRLKRYKERQKQFHDNNEFTNKPEKFYSKLRGTSIKIDKLPSNENIESFWKPIFET